MVIIDGWKMIVPLAIEDRPMTDVMLEEANRELARYAGATAKFWRYTATHSRLILEVRQGDEPYTYEYWSFSFVGHVCAPTGWRMVRPSVRRRDAESFIFSDEGVELDAVELGARDSYA